MQDEELLKQADEFLEITRPTSLALASEVSLVYKMKARLEELTADKEPASIVCEPERGDRYYFVLADGGIRWCDWSDGLTDKLRRDHHNIYKTRELAEKAAQHQKRFNMVLQAVLSLEPNQVVHWKDGIQTKYTPYFDHLSGPWSTVHGDGTAARMMEKGYPPLTDVKSIKPLLDLLNAKEKENG